MVAIHGTKILKCRTKCRSPDVNWLNIGDVVRVFKIYHQFFLVDLVQILQEV